MSNNESAAWDCGLYRELTRLGPAEAWPLGALCVPQTPAEAVHGEDFLGCPQRLDSNAFVPR